MKRGPFSPEEDAAIVAQWAVGPLRALAGPLDRRETAIHSRARALVKRGVLDPAQRWWRQPWSEAEMDTFLDLLGNVPLRSIARELGRSETALWVRKKRLGITQRDNWLTARSVAQLLGVDEKRVIWLIEHGLIAAHKSRVFCGKTRMWRIEVEALERFIRKHPAWYDRRRINEEPWLSLARVVWRADPVYTAQEAARRLGVSKGLIAEHCKRGWIAGEKVQNSGNHGTWYVRQSALDAWRPRRPELLRVAGRPRTRPAAKPVPIRLPAPRAERPIPKNKRPRFAPVEREAI